MKFKKLTVMISALLMVVLMPLSALGAIKINIHGDTDVVFSVGKEITTYIDMTATDLAPIKGNATVKLTIRNAEFAKDENGEYLPVFLTTSKGEKTRSQLQTNLDNGQIYGFTVIPTGDNKVSFTIPESMIDGYCQIMFTSIADGEGDVAISLSDNRNITYTLDDSSYSKDDDDEKDKVQVPKDPEAKKETVKITIGSNVMMVGDKEVYLDAPAYISGDYTKIPLRAIAELFGVQVSWSGDGVIALQSGDNRVTMKIGDQIMWFKGDPHTLSSVPEISNDRTFLPLRDIAGIFGIEEMLWDDETKTVTFECVTYI